ncbi:hypothetical protein TIFTF001_015970 [Ficus carica]|uniref:Uncharacterized protein n=1 Tax=Ficus carica TaxID=3494 RepID=A0AA88A6N2_FICCA|nr:hypothetical protein TIFTF001_015970 [Ficus carica]
MRGGLALAGARRRTDGTGACHIGSDSCRSLWRERSDASGWACQSGPPPRKYDGQDERVSARGYSY